MSEEELITLVAPAAASAASWNGREFLVEDGVVSVPRGAIDELSAHGYSLPKPKKAKSAKDSKQPATGTDAGSGEGADGDSGAAGEGA